MTNSEQALREFAEKWGIKQNDEPTFDPHTENLYYGYTHCVKQCLSDLTALISEGYVSKKAYNVIKEHYQSALAAKDINRDYINKYYYPKEFVEWLLKQDSYPQDNGGTYFIVNGVAGDDAALLFYHWNKYIKKENEQ